MRSLPIDTSGMAFHVKSLRAAEVPVNPDDRSVNAAKRQKTNVDGELVWEVEVMVTLDNPEVEDEMELRKEDLRVAVPGSKPVVRFLDVVEFDGLAGRLWEMNGRHGLSFSARSVSKAGAKSRPVAPAVPANGVTS